MNAIVNGYRTHAISRQTSPCTSSGRCQNVAVRQLQDTVDRGKVRQSELYKRTSGANPCAALQGSDVQLTVTEAAKAAGVSRTTIYEKIKDGELSRVNGKIDTAELLRVFGTP